MQQGASPKEDKQYAEYGEQEGSEQDTARREHGLDGALPILKHEAI